jgi:hypothetical protein
MKQQTTWKQLWCGLMRRHQYAKSRSHPGCYTCRNCEHRMKVTEVD